MKINTYLNKYGLLIFVSNKFISIMYNGLNLKLKQKKNININEIDCSLFYEMYNKSFLKYSNYSNKLYRKD